MKTIKLILKISLGLIGLGVLTYILLVSYLIFAPKMQSYVNQTPFDSKKWQAKSVDQNTIKQKMVNDLLSKYQLIGMTKPDIDKLLGIPQQTGYFKDYDYVYWLGPERSAFGIDSEWLGIKFEKDVVTKAEILRD